ncbi:MAG: YggS family pyridoxal phosphate-dependent enzyme [Deltaproteobacteria bacterium]|nr:YggS family pyridoxal phosphate-dependent enzyme [Deltaproteobacteria bacterium]
MIDIAGNIARVREQVARAEERAGRAAGCVRLIAVAKTKPAELVAAAIRAGITDIGENYVQEAAAKIAAVDLPACWHLIGHLQRNKAGRAVELFNVIQTVDQLALAEALDRYGARRGRPVRILAEINVGGEATKSGVAPAQADEFVTALGRLCHLQLEGLMTVPPPVAAHEAGRYFAALRDLRDRLARDTGMALAELSMGMTDDFEVAIAEGATMVRVGRAIFGPREGKAT